MGAGALPLHLKMTYPEWIVWTCVGIAFVGGILAAKLIEKILK
jgi:hypothetical protein